MALALVLSHRLALVLILSTLCNVSSSPIICSFWRAEVDFNLSWKRAKKAAAFPPNIHQDTCDISKAEKRGTDEEETDQYGAERDRGREGNGRGSVGEWICLGYCFKAG
jgi:hypothetical protein